MARHSLPLALLILVLLPAGANATSKPNFPKSYSGEISGSYRSSKDGRVITKTWTIKKVKFRLKHVRLFEGGWTGFYDVAAGTVSFHQTQTGSCKYEFDETFALKPSLPRHNPSTPFYMDKSPLGRTIYDGIIDPTTTVTVDEICSYPDQEPVTQEQKIEIGQLFDTGSRRGVPGRKLSGRYRYFDDYLNATTKWHWTLKPGR